jgi:hypothetical protein
MQKKRYGEKRKGGYVDMGKQVRAAGILPCEYFINDGAGPASGTRP